MKRILEVTQGKRVVFYKDASELLALAGFELQAHHQIHLSSCDDPDRVYGRLAEAAKFYGEPDIKTQVRDLRRSAKRETKAEDLNDLIIDDLEL